MGDKSVHIKEDLHKELKKQAKKEGMVLYAFVNRLISEWVDKQKKKIK